MAFPLISKTGKKYREVVEDGVLVHEFESGFARNGATGKTMRGPKRTQITPANHNEFVSARLEKKHAIVDKVWNDNAMVRSFKAAVDRSQGMDAPANKALELLLQHGGYAAPSGGKTVNILGSDELVAEAIKRLA